MPITPEARRTRARLAATKRHHPEADVTELEDELERARIDARIDEIVEDAKRKRYTPEQLAKLRRLFNPPAPVTGVQVR